jgi:hypothetical protein
LKAVPSLLASTADSLARNNFRFDVLRLFEKVAECEEMAGEQRVELEFQFYNILDDTGYKFPFIHNELTSNPSFFVYLLSLVYKRVDDKHHDDSDCTSSTSTKQMAYLASRILEHFNDIPGIEDGDGEAGNRLAAWIDAALVAAEHASRRRMAESEIGGALARAPEKSGKPWPPEHICDVLERSWSETLEKGFFRDAHNKVGMREVREGQTDAEWSTKYQGWAKVGELTHPRVASVLQELSNSFAHQAERHRQEAELRRQVE